jgi:hypothetical protein
LSFTVGKNTKVINVAENELKAINTNKNLVYVQDNPTLNNMDWNVSLNQSLPQMVSGRVGNVVKLQRADIAHFKPSTIYAPDKAVSFKPIQTSDFPPAHYIPFPLIIGDDDDDDKKGEPAIYLIVPYTSKLELNL